MRFEFKVTATEGDADCYGGSKETTVGLYRTTATHDAESLGRALSEILRFAVLANRGVEPPDVIGRLATELCHDAEATELFETAAERAAKEACVTLMHGVDCRMIQLQKVVDRLVQKVEG